MSAVRRTERMVAMKESPRPASQKRASLERADILRDKKRAVELRPYLPSRRNEVPRIRMCFPDHVSETMSKSRKER